MNPGLLELILVIVIVVVAGLVGRYYTYHHPLARKDEPDPDHESNGHES